MPNLPRKPDSPARVVDGGSHFELSFEVPGYTEGDIQVELLDNQLYVHGEARGGAIDRWFDLGPRVKQHGVEAHVQRGRLRVMIPKSNAV